MKKLGIFLLAVLLVSSFIAADAHAGPWTLKKGKLWTEVFTRYFFSKYYYDANGEKHRWEDGGFSEIWDLEGKLEYGITDNLNFRLGVPYAWSRWKNDWSKTAIAGQHKEKHEGFKKINAGFKYKFIDEPVTAAVQAMVYIHPETTDQAKAPDLFEYGDAVEGRFLIGKSFTVFKKPSYFSAESGYKLRSAWINKSEYGNSIPIFAEAGFSPFEWLMLKGEVDCSYTHRGTGKIKDTCTWRAGPIISMMGKGFSSVEKGGESSLNLELLYGQTFYAKGDNSNEKYRKVSAAQEFIFKVQVLW